MVRLIHSFERGLSIEKAILQSALFNFQSLLLVILLLICTCTYVRAVAPRLIDRNKEGCAPVRPSVCSRGPADFLASLTSLCVAS